MPATDTQPIQIQATYRALLSAALKDYATLLVLQQSLRTLPSDLHRAYEGIYGSPLHVESLAEDLTALALSIDLAPVDG